MTQSLENCAELLDQSEDYQVLRRLTAIKQFNPSPEPFAEIHKVCIIDTETTGLDTENCEILELGYQVIEFDSQGLFYRVIAAKNFLNEPEGEISAEVTQVTGITLADVEGHEIPWSEVKEDLQDVKLCVAHNAGFDRPVLERANPIFEKFIWGCSVTQINWLKIAGVSSRSQEFLCWQIAKTFYGAHRALDDVQALSLLLSQTIGSDQKSAFHYLLQSVRVGKTLVKATGAPFDLKDELKSRQYRWNASERVWQKMIDDDQLSQEEEWLATRGVSPQLRKLKANDTFSIRAQ
jgi:DNA polymerase-3 subunit epsilon